MSRLGARSPSNYKLHRRVAYRFPKSLLLASSRPRLRWLGVTENAIKAFPRPATVRSASELTIAFARLAGAFRTNRSIQSLVNVLAKWFPVHLAFFFLHVLI